MRLGLIPEPELPDAIAQRGSLDVEQLRGA
jgi:hypothetical protein